MKKLIECVPNFSEGNDMHIIDQITDAMKTVEGISVSMSIPVRRPIVLW